MTSKTKVRAGLMGESVFTKLGVAEASTRGGDPSSSKVKRERGFLKSHVIINLNFG